MKRLLAAGSGPIYQLCKAFRDGEAGSRHNPEFTILEWYRPGWDHHRLMDEVEELIGEVLGSSGNQKQDQRQRQQSATGSAAATRGRSGGESHAPSDGRVPGSNSGSVAPPSPHRPTGSGACVSGIPSHRIAGTNAERLTYREAFHRHVGLDPHSASSAELAARSCSLLGQAAPDLGDDRDGWLDLLLSHVIEAELGRGHPTFVHDFPVSQAALARVRHGDPPVAERFEVWVEGIELANGYHELTDPVEQRRRFEADLAARRERDLPDVPLDHRLLAALEHGLPDCSGVALGVDRLVMLAAGVERIDEVIAFPIDRA